ncbi:hypothetical protein ABPG74_006639 [Tetrahymena malaccensis]
MGLFDKIIFVGASVSMVGVFIYFRREKKFSQMMKDINLMKVYEFDQVIDYEQLPHNQMIALRATTDGRSSLRNARMDSSRDVVFSTIAQSHKPQQMFMGAQGFSFDVKNPQGMELNIQKTHGKVTILYDLHKITQDFEYSEFQSQAPLTLYQRFQVMRGQLKFAEYAILPNEQYIFIGKIQNQPGSKISLNPRIIIGDDKIKFLKYLDLYLAANNNKGKYCIGACLGFVATHYILTKLFPDQLKSKRTVVFKSPTSKGQNGLE